MGSGRNECARASREDSPLVAFSPPPRDAAAAAARRRPLADAFAAGEGPPPSPSTRAADAFRAARMGRADALEAMIRAGEIHQDATDASSEHAFSLLMAAAMNGAKGACRRLLSLGANASAKDARGRTALDLALEYGHDAVADLLAQMGTPFGDRSEAERADDASRRDASRSAEPSAPPAPTPERGDGRIRLASRRSRPARYRRERVTARSGVGNTRRPSRNGRKRRR